MINLNRNKLIVIGVILVILIFFYLVLKENTNTSKQNTITTTVSITPTMSSKFSIVDEVIPDIEVEQTKKDEFDYLQKHPLWKKLPYKTDEFEVSHYIKEMTLVVYITKNTDKESVKKEIDNWIISQGINPPNHDIEFRVMNR